MTDARPSYGVGPTLLSGSVLSLALLGDVLIYVILPVNAPLFGVSLFWVGVLLAANRIIRIFTLGAIASLAERVGPRTLAIATAVTSTVSTLIYGLGSGPTVLLIGRILWGLSFAALTLVIFSYAVADRSKAGTRVGLGRAMHSIGPALVALIGPFLAIEFGARFVFVIPGLATAISIPIAFFLPKEVRRPNPPKARWLPKPKKFDLFLFTAGLTVDGVFAVAITLTVAETSSIGTAMITGGVLIGIRRAMEAFLSPVGGLLGDRYGAQRLLCIATVVMAVGFVFLALGSAYIGGTLVVIGRAFIAALWPAEMAIRNSPEDTMHRLAVGQTWRDVGAATGPLIVGSILALMSLSDIYWITVVIVIIGLILQKRPAVT